MASDVSSGCTEVNELFDDEKEEGEISLEDVSSSEEGQLYKYPRRTYRGQCPHCLSMQHCATWCRSLTVNKVNSKRDGGVQGKENRGNRHYDKETAGVSNAHSKHGGLYSTLQEKNDDEGQNDFVPISSDSDMELVGLESTKKEKKRRKLHKKRRKKSPLRSDLSLALSIKESIHRLESGLFKPDAVIKSSHSRTRYSPDKKSMLLLPSQQRRHSRLSPPVMMRPRRPRSPLLRKSSPPLRQRKPPTQTISDVMNEEVDPVQELPSPRGSVDKLLKKVRNLEPFSSRSKEKGSSLKDKLSNIIKNDKKDSSPEATSCKENRSTDTTVVKRDEERGSKHENKSKDSDKKKEIEKEKEKTKEKDREKDKAKEKVKDREKEKAKEKEKSKDHEKGKSKEKMKEKEREKHKKMKDRAKEKVKEKTKEKMKEKEKKKIKEKGKERLKEKNKVKEKIQIKEEKEEEKHSFEENNEDEDDLVVLRQIALETKQKRNTLLRPEEIKIEPIDYEDEEMSENKLPKMPNFCMEDNDEDLQLRLTALHSAVIKKHRTRMQFGLKKKQTKNPQQKEQRQSAVPRMESPFTASFIDDFPLLAEICSPSSPLSKKDSLSVEDMVLDSDMELTAISEDESPYSPSDDIVDTLVDSSLYTPSKPTETPCPVKSQSTLLPTNDLDGSFLEFVNQESRPYSPTDDTIYDPDLPGVHSNTDTVPALVLTPPRMQHPQSLHTTPPLQPAPPLQPPPLPPLSMFATSVAVPKPMVLGCPPNMLNPFVDPTLANYPINPMMLPPPQLFAPFPSLPPPAPSLPASASQVDDFGETDLDGSPLVPIEKDGPQQQQQQWRLLNEPLYLQDLPPLGETQMNKLPLLTSPNLVPTAVLKSNKQLRKQPPRKSPAFDNSLFRNAEMTPVVLEPDVMKPCPMFKPIKLQPSAKKTVPLQPSTAFNSMAEDPDSPRTSQFNGQDADTPVEKARNRRRSVTPSPTEHKRKMSRRERRAAKRANFRERMRVVKTINTTTSKTEESKMDSDKRRRNSMEDDEDFLREILLASLAKRVKETDKVLPCTEPPTSDTSARVIENDPKRSTVAVAADVEKLKTDASSINTIKQSEPASKSNPTTSSVTITTSMNSMTARTTKTSKDALFSMNSLEITPPSSSLESPPTTSSPKTSSTMSSIATTTTKTTNNLKRSTSALVDAQPLSKIARKAASAKVVNNAKRYQNLLLQRKMALQKNSKTEPTISMKLANNGSVSQRSISPNVANLESNRLIINLNEDTESEPEKEEAKHSPTKERPLLSIPETEFEVSLNQFLKCARKQHEMATTATTAAATMTTTGLIDKMTSSQPDVETTSSLSTAEMTAKPSVTETTTITPTSVPTVPVSTTSSKISDTAIVTTTATVLCTSKEEATASTSKAVNTSDTTVKISTSITPPKITTITTSPTAKTNVTAIMKTNASVGPMKVSAGPVASALKEATNTVTKIDSTPKIVKSSVKTITNPAVTPLAVKHLPPPQQEEYRRLKQQIYEYERLKRLKAKESGTTVSAATNSARKNPVNDTATSIATSSPILMSPPSLTSLALASSTRKPASKTLVATISESAVSVASIPSITAVSTPSVTVSVSKPAIRVVSTTSVTAAVSTPPITAASKLSVAACSVKTETAIVTTPSTSITISKPIVTVTATPMAIVTSSSSKSLPTVSKTAPKSQLVATINPMAKSIHAEVLPKMSPTVLITPTKIVHSTAASTNLVKSVPNKTASVSNVATNRNIITSNPKVATSSPRIIPQSTQESPTKLLDKMNAALKNQRLQISAVAHKVSSLRILTREQINHKSTQNHEIMPNTNTANMNLNKISKEATCSNNSASKVVIENPPVVISNNNFNKASATEVSTNQSQAPGTSATADNTKSSCDDFRKVVSENPPAGTTNNNLNKTSTTEVTAKQSSAPTSATEVIAKQTPASGISATVDSTKNSWDDFKHEVNNEVQSLTDLTTEDQRNLLRDTEERLINKRHLVLDDITEMSSNLRQWEIERDLQNTWSSEVKKLREQLRIAEEKVQQQKEKLNSIQPKVSSYHEKINAGRKECFRLSKICSGLGQQVVGPSYKVPTAGAELLNNRIKEVATHTQKLKGKKAQSNGTLKNNNPLKTDNTKLKNNLKLNNSTNIRSTELNNRQNNFNVAGASLPNNHTVNTNSTAKTIGFLQSEEFASVNNDDSRIIKEEIIIDESCDENVSADSFNSDLNTQSRETNENNSFLNSENIRTDNSVSSAKVSNVSVTAQRLNSNVNNSELSTFSISNTQSEHFNSENENLPQNSNIQSILNVNEKTNTGNSLENKIPSRENFNKTISDKQTSAFVIENNVESENINSDSNFENPRSEIFNQNLLTTAHIDSNVSNADNLNGGSVNSVEETSRHIEKSVNECSFEQNAPTDSIVVSASINDESDKNLESEIGNTTPVVDNFEHTQQNELCLESSTSNVNETIENIKREPEMEMEIVYDSGSVLQSTVIQAKNVKNNNNSEDIQEFADGKINEKRKSNEENYQNEFPLVSGTEHSTLLEEINLLEIANAVEVPSTLPRYSQLFKKRKRTYRSLKKAEPVKDDNKKKKVPRPYESILKHLHAPRFNKTDGILCPYELMGTCFDGDCQYVHQSTSHS